MGRSQAQGQKNYKIDSKNIDSVLPKLSHDAEVTADIRNAVAAGKVVTMSEKSISFNGWNGSGYIIIDPNTGSGDYMISGGLNGGFSYFMGMLLTGLIITAIIGLFLTNPFGVVLGAAFIGGLEALLASVLWGILAYMTVTDGKCFIAGFKSGISIATFGIGTKIAERLIAILVGGALAHSLYDDSKSCLSKMY